MPAVGPASCGTSSSSAQPRSTGPRPRSRKLRSSVSPPTSRVNELAALTVATAEATSSAYPSGAPSGLTTSSIRASHAQVTGRPV